MLFACQGHGAAPNGWRSRPYRRAPTMAPIESPRNLIQRYNLRMATRIAPHDLQINNRQLAVFCRRHHIRKLSFFGSVIRDDFKPQSDVDICVEFEPGHVPGFDFFTMEAELSQMLGRKVDLQTANFLSPDIRRSALSESVVVYEQT